MAHRAPAAPFVSHCTKAQFKKFELIAKGGVNFFEAASIGTEV
jgi:hypothetical protein